MLFRPEILDLKDLYLLKGLSRQSTDGIEQKVRHRVKKDNGIEGGIPVVFSLDIKFIHTSKDGSNKSKSMQNVFSRKF